jgi:hypothetical protein
MRLFERSRKMQQTKAKPTPKQNNLPHAPPLKLPWYTIRTKDILHVMRLLGHKNIKNTMRYTQLVDLANKTNTVKVAWTLEESVNSSKQDFIRLRLRKR